MTTCLPFRLLLADPLEFAALGALAGCLLTLWLSHATRRNHS